MLKRFLSLFLLICITATLFPVTVLQADAGEIPASETGVRYGGPNQHINPLYEDVLDPDLFRGAVPSCNTAAATEDTEYVSEDEAAVIVREAMKARESAISFRFRTAKDVQAATLGILDTAFLHTGVPTEGDYLNRHYGGLTYEYSYYIQEGISYVTIQFYGIRYFSTAAQEKTLTDKIETLLDQLNLDNSSDFHKIRRVYDYICANVTYDYAHLDDSSYTLKYSAYAALVKKTAVCQGYSTLFYRLMLELDVDCRYISGYAGSTNHGWNIVKLGSKYYNVDATWDAGTSVTRHNWFLQSNASFTGHTRRSEYNTGSFNKAYPMSSKNYLPKSYSLPKITKQPVSQYVYDGETAKVYVTVSAESPTYQWYIYSSASRSYVKSSATGRSYSVTMSPEKSGRKVYCLVTDKYGAQVRTNTVTLNMVTPLEITKQPASVKVPNGATAMVSVSAVGDGLKYQWYTKNPGSSSYVKSSVTTSSYSIKMSDARAGRKAYCVITDRYGDSVQTKTVSLNKKDSPVITRQPVSVKVPSGITAEVSVAATGEGLTYQWYYCNSGSSTYKKASVASSTYSVTMSADRAGRKVYCVITDKYGNRAKSDVVTLSRTAAVKITKQPVSASAPSGEKVKVSLTATGTGLTYEWYYRDYGQDTFAKSSAGTASYSCTMTDAKDGRELYCVVTDKFGLSAQSDIVTLSVE